MISVNKLSQWIDFLGKTASMSDAEKEAIEVISKMNSKQIESVIKLIALSNRAGCESTRRHIRQLRDDIRRYSGKKTGHLKLVG